MSRKRFSRGLLAAAPALALALAVPAGRAQPAQPSANACELVDRDPAQARQSFAALGRALTASDPAQAADAEAELRACTRERSRRLAARKIWTPAETETLAALLLVDPERFAGDEAFRRKILSLLPDGLDRQAPAALRDDVLGELNQVRGFDFAASDALESAWGRTQRRAGDRRIDLPAVRFDADTDGRLTASIYSLPSFFFDAATVRAFVKAVTALDPERDVLVLTDRPMAKALGAKLPSPRVRLLETYGRNYSPWPRDPFSLVHDPSGRLIVLARPNRQPGREDDADLAAELVQNLPPDLDRRWGGEPGAAWATAPTPFHNGQVLLTKDAAWMTIHALEPRVLALLGLDRVPVESFGTAQGIDRYLAAVQRAAQELSSLYGRPVRFLHPLPNQGEPAARTALLEALGGGAGYDLDSIATLAPARGGEGLATLVADLKLGRELVEKAKPADLASVRQGYSLRLEGEALRAALLAAQEAPAARALSGFLDLVAKHLEGEGLPVRRLPLLSVPVPLLRDSTGLNHPELLLTWNNVVIEKRGDTLRAEGFASLFPPGDQAARETFAALGVRLDLLPPLVRSIVLNGGYRCASNHLRVGGGG